MRTPPFVQFEILKIPGIDFNSGFSKMLKGGGVQFEIVKNPGIDIYSGFKKNSQGGGGAIRNPKKSRYRLV